MKVTSTDHNDFEGVATLINHVFGKENSSTKMEDIFSDLICMDNLEHMRIIKVEEQPVSVVNYLINKLDIHGNTLIAASIGAVCTHEDHRLKGYSNQILRSSLADMRQEGVDFLYVSGEIELYTKNDIHITGKMHAFSMDQQQLQQLTHQKDLLPVSCEVIEATQADLPLLHDVYCTEKVKFIRDSQNFLNLIERVAGASVFNHASKIFCIKENGQLKGYIICALFPRENDSFGIEIVEYAGNRSLIMAGILSIIAQLKPFVFTGYTSWDDADMIKALEDCHIELKSSNYPGTMKIINFSQFMEKLKPLFALEGALEPLTFSEENGKYIIQSGSLELVIHDNRTMHHLFLGDLIDIHSETLNQDFFDGQHVTGDVKLYEMLKPLLPIPVPYPNNLNYI